MQPQKRYLDDMTGRGPFLCAEGLAKPNILLICMDMVPVEFYLDLPGAPEVRAPNIQSIKDNHLFFSRACATSPLCSPSRAAYLRWSCDVDELYRLEDSMRIVNLWGDPSSRAILDEGIVRLHERLARDPRWKGYKGFLELTYAEKLAGAGA